ncbi:acetyl-CoA carboxylase biotin carboxyl carrier protein [Fulvivirgaceae bacterium BMA10]|uniref:Biotin carboxyl carrier protein of acetyl-CoA carboxylase n=1 Tax=Splendidivirga corallicola TaxID=3051826 RepID=A0ABT8KRY8_9BACT|nr:acetyl-CoA carboxylase biotin carboxyl carrier protein [Fulvivirgaceae bacterium BMA10]
MKAKEIRDLIDFISKSGLDEVNIETEEFKIKVRKNAEPKAKIIETVAQAVQPSVQPVVQNTTATEASTKAPSTDAAPTEAASDEGKYISIKSPMIGTFYRSPNPDSDVFVKVGDKVEAGQTVCIVEAMKLFNEIESEVSGTIVKVLVDNASPIEYDQPLFLVDPS